MKLQTLRLFNFQSFGPDPAEVWLEDVTYLIGPNGSGKTAMLQALCRLFAFEPSLRRIQRSDFHVPFDEEDAPEERRLWVEADFIFPELAKDEENSTVAPHFGHMRLVECLDSSFIYDEVGILPAFSSWIERADAPASSSFCFNPF